MTIHFGPKEIIAFFLGLVFFAWMCYDLFGVLSKALNDFNNPDAGEAIGASAPTEKHAGAEAPYTSPASDTEEDHHR